jgi:arachidonate 5-lipoxygenase
MGNTSPVTNSGNPKEVYRVSVKTGNVHGAGTGAKVFLTLITANGSNEFELKKKTTFERLFKRGETDHFELESKPLGKIFMIKLKTVTGCCPNQDWFVEWVEVSTRTTNVKFPFFKWVSNDFCIPSSEAILPQNDNEMSKKVRAESVAKMQDMIEWKPLDKLDGLPNEVKVKDYYNLHADLFWDREKQKQQEQRNVKINVLISKFYSYFRTLDPLTDQHLIEKLFHLNVYKQYPSYINRNRTGFTNWKTDDWFIQQTVNGIRYDGLERVVGSLPSAYSITEDDVKGLLPEGKTLSSEIAAGTIYMVNNEIMKDLTNRKGKYCTSPLLIMHLVDGKMKPLAIQQYADKKDENPVWTPKDSPHEWLLAKIYFNNANGLQQTFVDHLLYTHLFIEPFAIALRRQLAMNHPIYKLLYESTRLVIPVNSRGRTSLLDDKKPLARFVAIGGAGSLELIRRAYPKMNFDHFHLKKNLAKRQISDKLKSFAVRDYGLKYWDITEKYVRTVLEAYYKSDQDVKDDYELQAWVKDTHKNGFDSHPSLLVKLESVEELVEFVVIILFRGSTGHAMISDGVFDVFGNIAFSPTFLRAPAPSKKGPISDKQLREAMMTNEAFMCFQASFTMSLVQSAPGCKETLLGEYPYAMFTDSTAVAARKQFSDDIEEIRKLIRANKGDYEYHYMKSVPSGITY